MSYSRHTLAEDAWRLHPAAYARTMSAGRWKSYRWAVILMEVLARETRRRNARVIVNAPPRNGKSTCTSEWLPAWYLDLFPEKEVIVGCYGDKLARRFGRFSRDHFRDHPDVWTRLSSDSKSVTDWTTTLGGGMRTTSVGGTVTGTGGDLIVIDDPHKDWAEAQSPVARQRVIDWFNGTLYSRAEPGASFVVAMTRWHERDLCGYLLEEHSDDWTHVCFEALCESENDLLGRRLGEPLCPERFDAEALDRIRRAVGPVVWAGTYQQRPAPADGGVIDVSKLKRYSELPPLVDVVFSWDLTFSPSGTSYYVGSVWGRSRDVPQHKYLVDLVRARGDYVEQKAEIVQMVRRYPAASRCYIELAANGHAAVAQLKSELSAPVIIGVRPKESKSVRVSVDLLPELEAGNVFVPESAPWLQEYLAELRLFPNGKNDDQIDVTTQALAKLRAYESEPIAMNLSAGLRPGGDFNPTVDVLKAP